MSILVIDIGGTKIRAGLVDGDRVVSSRSIPTEAARGADHVLSRVVGIREGFAGYEGVAVACAGVIADGRVISATDLLPGWKGTDVGGALAEATGVPVTVLGDVHAHGMGEAFIGAGAGHSSCLTVAVGTGIGGAFVEDGRLATGAHHLAGHIGHVSTGLAAGLVCSCGRIGHIEPLASGSGVMDRYEALTGVRLGGKEIDERAEAGEEAAVRVHHGAAFGLGEVLASVANMIDPAVIVLSGSMTRSGKGWWDALAEGFASSAMELAKDTPILLGTLGDDAPLLGAAFQFRKEWT